MFEQAYGFAQVGEWLKPTDCKSVPPSEVRRFESSPVHQVESSIQVNRLLLALAAYVALGILAWTTIGDQRVRLVTLAILGMFAFKTYLRRNEVLHSRSSEDAEK